MALRANPRTIGAFVIGAVVLLAVSLALALGGALFHKRVRAVAYFEGSVQGLSIGAPVSFRGVPIGSVSGIEIDVDMRNLQARIPVTMEFDPTRLTYVDGSSFKDMALTEAISKGLRARLVVQSIVTGQLMVDIDFHPDAAAMLVGHNDRIPEIPTMKSSMQQVQETIERLPLQDLVKTGSNALQSLDALMSSPELKALLQSSAAASQHLESILEKTDQKLDPTLDDLRTTLQTMNRTFADLDGAVKMMQGDVHGATAEIGPTLQAARHSLAEADRTFSQASATLTSLNGMVAPNTQARNDLEITLHSLAEASRNLRDLSAKLARNPNALLVGQEPKR